uniref:Transmembrane protein n=1 Tax=Solanum tuberosum TaxID=4113 RepID=M0ZLI5_SOLTU
MGRSILVVAVFVILFFSVSHGVGTGRKTIGTVSHQEKSRETYELDYIDAGPNFNSHGSVPVPSSPTPETPPQH